MHAKAADFGQEPPPEAMVAKPAQEFMAASAAALPSDSSSTLRSPFSPFSKPLPQGQQARRASRH